MYTNQCFSETEQKHLIYLEFSLQSGSLWAKESVVQSRPTHNSLCLASLLQLNANETPTLLFMKVQIRCLIVQNIYSSY